MNEEIIESKVESVQNAQSVQAVENLIRQTPYQMGVTAVETVVPSVMDIWRDKDSFEQTQRVAVMLSKSQLIPEKYQGKPQDCFVAIEMASRSGLSPLMVLQNLDVVKGKPRWSGQACMAIINSCGRFRDARPEYTGAKGTDKRGCFIRATRVSDGAVVDGTEVTLQMASAEGWTSNSKWRNIPEQMLYYRAAAFFARMYCPSELLGTIVEGEPEDIEASKQRSKIKAASATNALDAAIARGVSDVG